MNERRRVLNSARSRYERTIAAVVVWGRAREHLAALHGDRDDALDEARRNLERAEAELLSVYREL